MSRDLFLDRNDIKAGVLLGFVAVYLLVHLWNQELTLCSNNLKPPFLSIRFEAVRERQLIMSSSHYAPGISQGLVPVTCNMCSFKTIDR